MSVEVRASDLPDECPDDVCVDQSADLSFTIFEVAIEPRVLERDCRLRRKHLQHHDALRRENARCQIVFKIENANDLSLVDQWQTENGTDVTLNNIGIGRKRALRRRIIENHGLSRAYYISDG